MFQKGQSGNPKGRPRKGTALTDILREKMDQPTSDFPGAPSVKDVLTNKLISMANDGDIAALKYLFDRIDGTPVQAVELTGDEGGPIESLVKVELVKPSNS